MTTMRLPTPKDVLNRHHVDHKVLSQSIGTSIQGTGSPVCAPKLSPPQICVDPEWLKIGKPLHTLSRVWHANSWAIVPVASQQSMDNLIFGPSRERDGPSPKRLFRFHPPSGVQLWRLYFTNDGDVADEWIECQQSLPSSPAEQTFYRRSSGDPITPSQWRTLVRQLLS